MKANLPPDNAMKGLCAKNILCVYKKKIIFWNKKLFKCGVTFTEM